MIKTIVFKILGMHCTACALNIDGDLEDSKGVKEARTNYAKARTEVEFDPDKITVEEVVKIINKTGYTAELQK